MEGLLMKEEAVLFGERKSLVGVVTEPRETTRNPLSPAVILLNPGIVHRVGPGRIHVKIARALAAIGFVVLRFDFSGIGDSAVRHDNLRFEKSAVRETQDAMDFLKSTRRIEHFVLLGGCSGAFISLETVCCDARPVGAILINYPATEGEDEHADADLKTRRTAHYYRNFAFFDRKSWGRLLTGKTNYRQLIQVLQSETKRRFAPTQATPRKETPLQTNLQRLSQRNVRLTFLCSRGDPLLDELREAGGNELQRLCALGQITLDIIPHSDHTFSSLEDHERLLDMIVRRIRTMTLAESFPAPAFEMASHADIVTTRNSVIGQ